LMNLRTDHIITNFCSAERHDDTYLTCHVPVFQDCFIYQCILEQKTTLLSNCARGARLDCRWILQDFLVMAFLIHYMLKKNC
jgi:hypothetical protein